jgi:hypothetical protein
MQRTSIAAVLTLALAASAAPLAAQGDNGRFVHFGMMIGATTPVGQVADFTRRDMNLGALVTFGAPESHLNFRVDGQWQWLAGQQTYNGASLLCASCHAPIQPDAQSYRVIDVTTSAVYDFEPAATTNFYLIAGIGVYNEKQYDPNSATSASATRLGINGGAGIRFRLAGLQPFVEARYHDMIGSHSFAFANGAYNPARNIQFVPLNVGFVF